MSEKQVKIGWWGRHFGEEPPLVGASSQGAGGIFFSGCNLRCQFCQNWQLSQVGLGEMYSIDDLVKIMLDLQSSGAANIDLVTPTIWWQQIKEAIIIAKRGGLTIPIVWNSNGYEIVNIIKNMEGLVDIYLPDFKYGFNDLAKVLSQATNYLEIARLAIREMYHQVGLFEVDDRQLAKKGLIVRHLILPGLTENSYKVLEEIVKIDKSIHVSLMSQYNPLNKKYAQEDLSRKLTPSEFNAVCDYATNLGLINGWVQDPEAAEIFLPDFTQKKPF